jgi:acetyl esterase/lipase
MIAELLVAAGLAVQGFAAGEASAAAGAPPQFSRTQDLVYGRPDGTALTMDEFVPEGGGNGKVILVMVSGGWYSSHEAIDAKSPTSIIRAMLGHGYKVYAVVHRSSPRFTIEEAVADVQRAVRFVREREARGGRSSVSIGVTGGSAGGHLSLMLGTCGDDGLTTSAQSLERRPSRVQAVACYFPPTDFLNYGDTHVDVRDTTVGKYFPPSFDFQRQETSPTRMGKVQGRFTDVSWGEATEILKQVSPANHVSPDDAPALIIHGDADTLVPLQQSKLMVEKLKAAGVEASLIIKPAAGHGWAGMEQENEKLAEWFDDHL